MIFHLLLRHGLQRDICPRGHVDIFSPRGRSNQISLSDAGNIRTDLYNDAKPLVTWQHWLGKIDAVVLPDLRHADTVIERFGLDLIVSGIGQIDLFQIYMLPPFEKGRQTFHVIDSFQVRASGQPFTAPMVNPEMICSWNRK